MSIAGRIKPNPKKKYSRLEITQAGRERLSRKRQKNNEYGDNGINAEGLAWAKMAEGPKQATYEADRKALLDAEKRISYNAGVPVNMYKRAVKKSYRDQQSKQDASILRQRGQNAHRDIAGSGTNPADRTSPSNVQSIIDFFRDPGDKRYTSMDVEGRSGKWSNGYTVRRTQMTSQERRLAKLRAKGKKRTNATL